MSERKVKDAIFAQRDAPRRARVSWLPASQTAPASSRRRVTDESAHHASGELTAPVTKTAPSPTPSPAPLPSPLESSDACPATLPLPPESPSSVEPPHTVRGFFDELSETAPAGAPPPMTDVQSAIDAFVQAAEALSEIRALRHSRVERDLVELAGAIAERVLGRELTIAPTLLAALARDGIAALADRENVTVRFSSDTPDEARARLVEAINTRAPECKIVFDRELCAGSCVVESAQGFVDESVTTRLDVVMEQLGFGGGGME